MHLPTKQLAYSVINDGLGLVTCARATYVSNDVPPLFFRRPDGLVVRCCKLPLSTSSELSIIPIVRAIREGEREGGLFIKGGGAASTLLSTGE